MVLRLEVKPEESWTVEKVLEVPEGDVADGFVHARHERSHRTVGEVEDLGRKLLLLLLLLLLLWLMGPYGLLLLLAQH